MPILESKLGFALFCLTKIGLKNIIPFDTEGSCSSA
jgi:hypothetical protein